MFSRFFFSTPRLERYCPFNLFEPITFHGRNFHQRPNFPPLVGKTPNGGLGGGFKYFLFSPLFGEDSQFDDHIFQRGWNHHLVVI